MTTTEIEMPGYITRAKTVADLESAADRFRHGLRAWIERVHLGRGGWR